MVTVTMPMVHKTQVALFTGRKDHRVSCWVAGSELNPQHLQLEPGPPHLQRALLGTVWLGPCMMVRFEQKEADSGLGFPRLFLLRPEGRSQKT